MHSLRGTKYLDPVRWVDSIDLLRSLKADYLVPTHGQPVYGAEKTEELLRMTRDGIQYVHDQTVRHMNKDLTSDELVQAVADGKIAFSGDPKDLARFLDFFKSGGGSPIALTVR